jgi:hypothetical protein
MMEEMSAEVAGRIKWISATLLYAAAHRAVEKT